MKTGSPCLSSELDSDSVEDFQSDERRWLIPLTVKQHARLSGAGLCADGLVCAPANLAVMGYVVFVRSHVTGWAVGPP